MKILKETIRNKIAMQAEEAKELGLKKIADAVSNAINDIDPILDDQTIMIYNRDTLETKVYGELWELALEVVAYHDLKSANIQKIDKAVIAMTDKFVKEIEGSLQVSDQIGPLESKLFGEK